MARDGNIDLTPELSARVDKELRDAEIVGGEELGIYGDRKIHGPPGTGKSTQKDLLKGEMVLDGVTPRSILDATYRRSQAEEIADRMLSWGLLDDDEDDGLGMSALDYHGTIHSVAAEISGILEPEGVEIANDKQKAEFCHQVLKKGYWLDDPWDRPLGRLALDALSWYRCNLIDPVEAREYVLRECPHYEELTNRWPGLDMARVAETWEVYKDHEGLVDFWELLDAAAEVGLPGGVSVVFVDEYHDVYPLMHKATQRWLDEAETAVALGDPDQVVNSFSGSSPDYWHSLDLPSVQLEDTHRVPETNWRAACDMLDRAPDHAPPAVNRDSVGQLEEYRTPPITQNASGEWETPGPDVERSPTWLWYNHGPDILYLQRTEGQSIGVATCLERQGIPYRAQDKVGGWQRDRLRALHNALVVLSAWDVSDFVDSGRDSTLTGDGEGREGARPNVLTSIQAAELMRHTPAAMWELSRDDLESEADLRELEESPLPIDVLADMVKPVFWRRLTHGAGSVGQLIKGDGRTDRDLTAMRRLMERRGAVHLDVSDLDTKVLTIHASKGSEAETVILYDGATRRIKESMRESRDALNNEMRTWFVGLTRASKRTFVMTGWDDHTSWVKPLIKDRSEGLVQDAQVRTRSSDRSPADD